MTKRESYNTKQKDELLNAIKNKKGEFTIKDIYNELDGKVGLTTIYRFVDKLVFDNKINKSIGLDNITYYQYLKECNHDNHFYLKCEKCGDLTHVDCDCVKELSSHIKDNHKFTLNKENIIINGICNKCVRKGK